jgi:hypothetical protein
MEDTYSSRRAAFDAQVAAMNNQQEVSRRRAAFDPLGLGDTHGLPGERSPGQLDLGKNGKGEDQGRGETAKGNAGDQGKGETAKGNAGDQGRGSGSSGNQGTGETAKGDSIGTGNSKKRKNDRAGARSTLSEGSSEGSSGHPSVSTNESTAPALPIERSPS